MLQILIVVGWVEGVGVKGGSGCLTDGQQAPAPAVEVDEDRPICPTQPAHWLVDLHSDVPDVSVRNLINKAIYLYLNNTFKSFFLNTGLKVF